jgi:hypothetical protein
LTILARYQHDRLNRLTQTQAQDGPSATSLETYGYTPPATAPASRAAPAQRRAMRSRAPVIACKGVAGTARTYDAAGYTRIIGGTAREFVYNDLGRLA